MSVAGQLFFVLTAFGERSECEYIRVISPSLALPLARSPTYVRIFPFALSVCAFISYREREFLLARL